MRMPWSGWAPAASTALSTPSRSSTRAASGERYSPQIFGRGKRGLVEEDHGEAALGEEDGGRGAGRSGADHDDVGARSPLASGPRRSEPARGSTTLRVPHAGLLARAPPARRRVRRAAPTAGRRAARSRVQARKRVASQTSAWATRRAQQVVHDHAHARRRVHLGEAAHAASGVQMVERHAGWRRHVDAASRSGSDSASPCTKAISG